MAISGRQYIKDEVERRARHATAEDVRTTCSFARAERLIGREYHGRFLIELLQNAADAWRNDPRSFGGERSRVAILISEGPALLIANQGAPMAAAMVIESLGHIGASTKSEGEAIGHKGIGFKSVLEITLTPEIYSGLQDDSPALAVKFDPNLACLTIQSASRDWSGLIAGVQGMDQNDELAAVPVLRFPHWVEDIPAGVKELAARNFDTVVRLPFANHFADRLKLDEKAWLCVVREALRGVSDQILLLLGCFSEVIIEDRLEGTTVVVAPTSEFTSGLRIDNSTREVVNVFRNGKASSRWRLFRRRLREVEHLAGEIAVGIRLGIDSNGGAVLPAVDQEGSAPFHLFFPTRIASGLPFLLHGYFEVDAARTGFYRGSASRNAGILHELAALTADAVRDTAKDGETDLVNLVNLVADADKPEDLLAREFRDSVLSRLDEVEWIPIKTEDQERKSGRPSNLFVCSPALTRHVAKVFPADYTKTRVDLALPHVRLGDAALNLIRSRQVQNGSDQWKIFAELCRPGSETSIWQGLDADDGFRNFLDLIAALEVDNRAAATALLDGLKGDRDSCLLPTVAPEGGRRLLPVPDPAVGVPGRRSRLVMARIRVSGDNLIPPDELDLAFLREGLLTSDAEIDRAKPLGVREFTVDNILDRLNDIGESAVDPEALLRFLWQLLSRERVSGFGTKTSAEHARTFSPAYWFWCHPGDARQDDSRLRQQRARYLTGIPVLCQDTQWRAAGTVVFGADWAEWLESGAVGDTKNPELIRRAAAYRVMESIAPGPHAILAPPEAIMRYFPAGALMQPNTEDGEESEEALDEKQRNAERHSFMLRLGVWEVPPIEAFESRTLRNRENFPWAGAPTDLQKHHIANVGGWKFGLEGWSGQKHNNVYLAEDFRFVWSLEEMAGRNTTALMKGLQSGAALYGQRLRASVFCPRCADANSSHTATRYSSDANRYPSCLALQLRNDCWASCTLDGKALDHSSKPTDLWWHPKPPLGAGLRQSAYRWLRLCSPFTGMTEDLRHLAGVHTLETANNASLRRLLKDLGADLEREEPSGTERQALISLHRLVYERLAELAADSPDDIAATLKETGVLCELGDRLVYQNPADSYHDDGRYATYLRHFTGKVPLVTLPRDNERIAACLGIQRLEFEFDRKGNDQGLDVTAELRGMLGDRTQELLAIVVHHSLGTKTMEIGTSDFDERARRLQALTVRQLSDLVIEASIAGGKFKVTIGQGVEQEIFLENPTSKSPVLFHDLSGDGWQDRLRRKIAPHLALVLENQAYSATFALFLQAESDSEREEFLLELGISGEDVEDIAMHIGIANEEDRKCHQRWYRAVLESRGRSSTEIELGRDMLIEVLAAAGIDEEVVHRLVDAGGSEDVRRDTSEGRPLRLLNEAGVDLAILDMHLRQLGDPGLTISVARRLLSQWLAQQGRRCAAVLATRQSQDLAKASLRNVVPPESLLLSIDPQLEEVLEPVIRLLRNAGIEVVAKSLAECPADALMEAGGFQSEDALNSAVLLLYDDEEQERLLRELVGQWRRELRLLAVLARTGPSETKATIRKSDEAICKAFPANPSRPTELLDTIAKLFVDYVSLAEELEPLLSDSVISAVPARDSLLRMAEKHGVDISRLTTVERAIESPRRDQAREIKQKRARLVEKKIVPCPPLGLVALPPKAALGQTGPKVVPTVHVAASRNHRNRELGDEGEQWALAAIMDQLLKADGQTRDAAVDQVLDLLGRFDGPPVEAARSHAGLARSRDLEEEELIDELTGLLHVSRHSDAFGFDLIGWLPPSPGSEPQVMCLEIKSSVCIR